jgi:F-type H+-transporting ATPase subunit gamma
MAGGREIKTKIKSVQNTRKVTRALEMVSASKIRKAQDLMKASRPYTRLMRQVIGHIAKANIEYKHPFLVERPVIKRVAAIVVSTDRGLCGGLNSNLFRRLLAEIKKRQELGQEVDVVAIGQKAVSFFKRVKVNLVASVTHLGERPQVEELMGVAKVVFDSYRSGNVDEVFLVYNRFINTMSQQVQVDRLLPLPPSDDEGAPAHDWDYLYEPDPHTVLQHVLTRYAESLLYQAALENLASEHAARMVAMKSASDNATKLIGTLQLVYNKARQAAITQEISEIVGGAAAV